MNTNIHACLSSVFDEIHSFFSVFRFVSLSNAGVPVFGAGAGKAGLMQSTGVLTQRFVKKLMTLTYHRRSLSINMDDSNDLTMEFDYIHVEHEC